VKLRRPVTGGLCRGERHRVESKPLGDPLVDVQRTTNIDINLAARMAGATFGV
jgi:hypothetical protein